MFEARIVLLLIGLVQLNVLAHQAVALFGDEADLVEGKVLLVQDGDLNKVGQIAFDAGLGVVGFQLDLGEGVVFQIEVDDDGFVRQAGSHVKFGTAGDDEHALVSELRDIAFDGAGAGGQDHGQVFVAEQSVLIVGLSGEASEAMASEAGEAVISQCLQVGVEVNEA